MKPSSITIWCKRFAWLGLIWLLSILVLATIAYLLRFVMSSIGMTVS